MYKTLIHIILILALLGQIGCYSLYEMNKGEVISNKEYDNLIILTKDSLKYKFEKPDFYIINDTLKGNAGKVVLDIYVPENLDANTPLSDITKFETKKYDGQKPG